VLSRRLQPTTVYLSLIDSTTVAIESRFESERWNFLSAAESAFIDKPVDTRVISKFYGSDVDVDRLQLHVNMYHDLMEQKHI